MIAVSEIAADEGRGACRLCGRYGPVDDAAPLADLVLKYTGISISDADPFPRGACDTCSGKIRSFDRFARDCLAVQARFADMSELEMRELTDADAVLTDPIKTELSEPEQHEQQVSSDECEFEAEVSEESPESDHWEPKSRKRRKTTSAEPKTDHLLKTFFAFQCTICQEDMDNWYRLKMHMMTVHDAIPKTKCVCGYEVRSRTAIYRHAAAHNNPAHYVCDQCPRMVKTLEALETHKLTRHAPKPDRVYPCASCGKMFNTKEGLKSHERVHIPLSERYTYPCNVCGNKFTTKSAVVGHIRAVHEKIKRYVCDVCGYACSTGGELMQHRAIHSDIKMYECKMCAKRFKTSSNLKAHMDTHDATSYPCGMCGKVLNSRRTLRKHFLVHEDICKHICTFCNKAFKRRQTLKVHLTTHTGDKPIQCTWCPAKFAFSSALRSHRIKIHKDRMVEVKEEMRDIKTESVETCAARGAGGGKKLSRFDDEKQLSRFEEEKVLLSFDGDKSLPRFEDDKGLLPFDGDKVMLSDRMM